MSLSDDLGRVLEEICPTSLAEAMDRDRPYDGQPHTDHGVRGQTMVSGLTFRDVRDCLIRACYDSSGLPVEQWPGSVHDLPWADMSIIAVQQNLSCWIEKYMDIYPNRPRDFPEDPTDPHWCGWPIDAAEWTLGHEGECRP